MPLKSLFEADPEEDTKVKSTPAGRASFAKKARKKSDLTAAATAAAKQEAQRAAQAAAEKSTY